jgi:hypothetical protein
VCRSNKAPRAVGIDAVTSERSLELGHFRHHEAEFRLLVGEFALQIEKIRAGNMPGLEGVVSRHRKIGNIAALGCGFEVGGAIEQAQIRLFEPAREFRCGDQLVVRPHPHVPPGLADART